MMTGANYAQGSSLPNSSESTPKERHREPPRDANFGAIQGALGRIIKKFNVVISTSTGQDAVLASIEYLSHSLHYQIVYMKSRHALPIDRNRKHLDSKISPILALSSIISDARYTLRLLGAIRLLKMGLGTAKCPASNPKAQFLAYAQIVALLMYQVLENMFYLTTKGVIPRSFLERLGRIEKWSLWSSRFLLSYFLLQLLKLSRECRLWEGCRMDKTKDGGYSSGRKQGEERETGSGTLPKDREWWKSSISTALWTPLCVHWSLKGGIGIPNVLCGIFGFLAGAGGLYDMLKEADNDQ